MSAPSKAENLVEPSELCWSLVPLSLGSSEFFLDALAPNLGPYLLLPYLSGFSSMGPYSEIPILRWYNYIMCLHISVCVYLYIYIYLSSVRIPDLGSIQSAHGFDL